jgi:hypothetical protein
MVIFVWGLVVSSIINQDNGEKDLLLHVFLCAESFAASSFFGY